jgi:hypothetical protein
MNTEVIIKELLLWRMARAQAEAPRPPHAAQLLELSRPWWETWPERFQTLVDRLSTIQVAYGHAMAETRQSRTGHPVSTLIVHSAAPVETTARVLYIEVRGGRLRLRFQLDKAASQEQPAFEITFISPTNNQPLLVAQATRSVDSEYRVETELPDEVAKRWTDVRVTDQMPFGLILRPADAKN